ncbi:MAG: factor-independent urate hydroxylase, partial [Thermoanaerobaculia bacterium]
MSPTLLSHRYGKQKIRLTHLDRSTEPHRLTIAAVGVTLEGDFAASYTAGDNREVVATDSIKNTVYVLAREHGVESIEEFGVALARHFVGTYATVAAARIDLEEEIWSPIRAGAESFPDAFERVASETGTASALLGADGLVLTSGIEDLQVLKSSHSGFVDFVRDRYTTLPDVDDRLFATSVGARWRLADGASGDVDFRTLRAGVRQVLVESFARHDSLAVQQTLHAMGIAVLDRFTTVAEINLVLPNQHHLLANLA